jgi:glycosyltransferase involved in cell wall biosynthesis
MARVVVVQPYIPQYRVPFFERLATVLADSGVELVIAAGSPEGDQAARGDGVELTGVVRLPERRLGFGGRSVVVRSLRGLTAGADLVILEQARRNIEAYPLLFGQSSVPVALWGHGRTSTRDTKTWEHRWLDRMTLRASWFFAYTEGGRDYVVDRGFPVERTTVVQNSTDTAAITRDLASVTATERATLTAELGLTAGRTGLFLGALDKSKRITFLRAAAAELAERLPGFTLIIAGDGPMRPTVELAASEEPWLRYVGPVCGRRKAAFASVSDVMLNPGRVGLNLVDSFALQVPMITTDWDGHAPEFEYLVDGVNGKVTDSGLEGYVTTAARLLSDPGQLAVMRSGCRASRDHFSVEQMARRFAEGSCAALQITDQSRAAASHFSGVGSQS